MLGCVIIGFNLIKVIAAVDVAEQIFVECYLRTSRML